VKCAVNLSHSLSDVRSAFILHVEKIYLTEEAIECEKEMKNLGPGNEPRRASVTREVVHADHVIEPIFSGNIIIKTEEEEVPWDQPREVE